MDSQALSRDSRIERVLIPERRIRERIEELAAEIAADYRDRESLHIVGVLTGAFVFLADLARALRRAGAPPARYYFLQAGLYGNSVKTAADEALPSTVRIGPAAGESGELAGRDVLLVEDILDRGLTLSRVCRHLTEEQGVREIRICVLLDKILTAPPPEIAALRRALPVKYVGFSAPDRWVAGYGLDAAGLLRDLPCIVALRESAFR